MWQDLRQAVRTLRTHRGFVVMASLVLALGIGLNTAIFSIVYGLLWKPLSVSSPHELVYLYQVFPRQPNNPNPIPPRVFESFRQRAEAFTDITAHWGMGYSLHADDETDTVNAEWVFSNYFTLLGVTPALGRTLLVTEDDASNPERAVVISHALWARRFRSDPNIVGRKITLARWGETYTSWTVVGVMRPDFQGLAAPWAPTQVWMSFQQAEDGPSLRFSVAPIARLKPGVSLQQAGNMIAALGHNTYIDGPGRAYPQYEPRFVVYPANSVRMPFDPSAVIVPARLAGAMTVVVAMVLLVAATNIAGILMARGLGRAGELAIRRALGAGPWRIARQLLAESVALGLLGGVGGFVLGAWLVGLFRAWTPLQYAFEVSMNRQVSLFTAAICLGAGIIVGIFPAHQAARLNVLSSLGSSGNLATKQTRARVRHAITVPQVAVSLVLLLVGEMYVRALLRVELSDLGYQPQNLLVVQPILRAARRDPTAPIQSDMEERHAERSRRFYRQLLDRLRAVPGALDIAVAESIPVYEPSGRANWSAVTQESFFAGDRNGPGAERTSVSPGYFRTMGMRIIAGRDFDGRDNIYTPKVAMMSAGLVARLWPGREALGRTFTMVNSFPSANEKNELYEVVGIVNEVSPILQDLPSRPLVYFPLSQQWRPLSYQALVRGAGDSRTLIPAMKAAVIGADPLADVGRARLLSQIAAEILYPRRIAAVILAASGFIALCLATIGVYSAVSYSIAQRTGEIAVRMALGADRRDIVRLILREGRTVATLGSIAGLVFGYAVIRATSSRYLALPQIDIATMAATPLLLGAVVLLACYVPATRAGRVNPMDVLRRS
jgi:putative ABC transport system permease protein